LLCFDVLILDGRGPHDQANSGAAPAPRRAAPGAATMPAARNPDRRSTVGRGMALARAAS
jgi:hypothetical protein